MRWYLSRYWWALIRYLMEIIWSDSQILPCSRHHAGAWSRGAGGTHFNTKRSLLAENSYSTGRGAITQMKIRSDWEGCGCRIVNQLQWEHRGEKIPSVLGSPRGLQGKAHIGVLLSFWGCGLDKWEGSRCSAAQSCPTLCSPMGCSLQTLLPMEFPRQELLERGAISFCRGSSWPRDRTCISCVSCIVRQILYHLRSQRGSWFEEQERAWAKVWGSKECGMGFLVAWFSWQELGRMRPCTAGLQRPFWGPTWNAACGPWELVGEV